MLKIQKRKHNNRFSSIILSISCVLGCFVWLCLFFVSAIRFSFVVLPVSLLFLAFLLCYDVSCVVCFLLLFCFLFILSYVVFCLFFSCCCCCWSFLLVGVRVFVLYVSCSCFSFPFRFVFCLSCRVC